MKMFIYKSGDWMKFVYENEVWNIWKKEEEDGVTVFVM